MAKCTHSLFASPLERFVRDSVVYGEFAYRIDRAKSSLQAYVQDEELSWALEIECLESVYPDNDEGRLPPSCAPSLILNFPSSVRTKHWRALEGNSYKFTFDDDVAFPLLPGIPSGAYIGYHRSCTDHHFSFGALIGTVFQIRWKPLARADEYDSGCYFYVDADVPFTGIQVQLNDDRYDLESVQNMLKQWFDLGEFAAAEHETNFLWLPIKSAEDVM